MIANSSPASALTASRNGGTKPPKRQKARPVRSGVSAGQDGITAVKSAGHSMSRTDEYLTWLDWYASGAAEKLAASGYPNAARYDDAEALWIMSVSRVASFDITRERDLPAADMAQFSFFAAISGFLAPEKMKRDPAFRLIDATTRRAMFLGGTGLKLSKRLVQSFAHAKAPKTDDWKALVRQCGWYLDLPHHALMLDAREVRAIITQPDDLGGVVALAILVEPGGNEMAGRYAWMILGETAHPTGCADIDVDALELQRRANDFIALSLLYYQSLEHCEALPRRQTGPHLSKIQRKLERKTKSLFVVHNLPDPVGNLGRPVEPVEAGEAGGWHLDHRVTVRGHFRWQPVGEGRSHRELRWIAEHHRGIDLPEKPQLIPLRRPNT